MTAFLKLGIAQRPDIYSIYLMPASRYFPHAACVYDSMIPDFLKKKLFRISGGRVIGSDERMVVARTRTDAILL